MKFGGREQNINENKIRDVDREALDPLALDRLPNSKMGKAGPQTET